MSELDLRHYRRVLEKLALEYGVITSAQAAQSEVAVDAAASASETAARSVAASYLNWLSLTRRLIEWALKRIDEGRYGQCLHCEEGIDTARLNAIPFAPFCLACQRAIDNGLFPKLNRYRTGPEADRDSLFRAFGTASEEY